MDGSSAPFHDALIRPAAGSEVLDRPEAARLGLRIKNLGVDRYSVWAAPGT